MPSENDGRTNRQKRDLYRNAARYLGILCILALLAFCALPVAGDDGATQPPDSLDLGQPPFLPDRHPFDVAETHRPTIRPRAPVWVWQIETVVNTGTIGFYTSLALDESDFPHISYKDYDNAALKYAYYDGATWQIETVPTDSSLGWTDTSLALDSADRPHISYFDGIDRDLKHAYQTVCVAIRYVDIVGPPLLPIGIGGLYTATYRPLTATLPVTWTWDNGTVGSTAVYSWTTLGSFSLTVSATNPCTETRGTFTVTTFCQPVEGVVLEGPLILLISQTGTYQAVAQPITASQPLTFTWDNGTVGLTANYSWTMTGTYTLMVSATNVCGDIQRGFFLVQVSDRWLYYLYFPLILRR